MRISCHLLFVFLQCQLLVAAHAQSVDREEVLSRSAALSSAGEFSAVVSLLDSYVEQHPDDADAWLILAQHLYWEKDINRARATYELALQHHPAREDVRLAFARFLLENGEGGAARTMVRSLGSNVPEAEAIRGTIAWWSGDLTGAVRSFKRALEANPGHQEAASALASIRAGSRPWVRVSGQSGTDSQPVNRNGASAEAGLFLTPLQTLRVQATHTRFSVPGSVVPMTFTSVEHQSFWPAVRLETELSGSVASRSDTTYLAGRVEMRIRLPYGLRTGARWERIPYLHTAASISETVTTSALQANLSLDRAGWIGEAAIRRERFPDDNTKDVVFGWLMAPLVRSRAVTVQAGYAYGYQNAAEHRFNPILISAPNPRRPPTWEGRYAPYYTPMNQQVHSGIASIQIRPVDPVTMSANGSFGFYGSEKAPYVYLVGQAPAIGLFDNQIRPWNVRIALSAQAAPSVTLQLEGSYMATTWYDASSASLTVYTRL